MTEGDCGATLLRAARDADAADIIELIAAAYAEYPGCVLDIEADMPELIPTVLNIDPFHGSQSARRAGAACGAMRGPRSQMAGKRRPRRLWAPGGPIGPTPSGPGAFCRQRRRASLAVSRTAAQRAPDWRQKSPR